MGTLGWATLGQAVGIDLAIAVVVILVFNYLRKLPWHSDFYMAKRKLSIPFRCEFAQHCWRVIAEQGACATTCICLMPVRATKLAQSLRSWPCPSPSIGWTLI